MKKAVKPARTTKPIKKPVPQVPFSQPQLKDSALVGDSLLGSLRSGDLDAFRMVLVSHIVSANKMQLAKKAGLSRRALYDMMDLKQKFNPELSTLSSVIRGLAV